MIHKRHNLVLAIWFVATLAYAVDVKRPPVYVYADIVQFNNKQQKTVFHGHVSLQQGNYFLSAASAETINLKKQLIKAIAKGDKQQQAVLHIKPTHTNESPIVSQADKIIFLPQSKLIVLKGNAALRQGTNTFYGAHLRYDIIKKRIISNGRVSARTSLHLKTNSS